MSTYPEQARLLTDCFVAVREKLATMLGALDNAEARDEQYYGALAVWKTEFEVYAEQAQAGGEKGLALVCAEVAERIGAMQDEPVYRIKQYCQLLVEWIDDITPLIGTAEPVPADRLLLPVPESKREELRALLGEPETGSDPDLDSDSKYAALLPIVADAVETLERQIEKESLVEFFEDFSVVLDNISMAAEMLDYAELEALCERTAGRLKTAFAAQGNLHNEQAQAALAWLAALYRHLQQTEDTSLPDAPAVMAADETEDGAGEQQVAQQQEAWPAEEENEEEEDEEDQVSLARQAFGPQGAEDPQEADQYESTQDNPVQGGLAADNLLLILSQELGELSVEMTELVESLSQEVETEESRQAAVQYLTLVERLAETSEALGLRGLQKVCEFITHNFNLTLALETKPEASAYQVFRDWPGVVLNYLEDPENEDRCLSLIGFLQQDLWPEQLADEQARELLRELARQIELPDEVMPGSRRSTEARPEDVTLEVAEQSSQGMLDAFFQESPVIASRLSAAITQIANGVDVRDNVVVAQRCAHTLKGSAGLIGVNGIANLTHHLEDILEYLSTNADAFPRQLVNVLQEATDCVESMLDAMQGRDDPPEAAQAVLQSVLDWANCIDQGQLADMLEDDAEVLSFQQQAQRPQETEPDYEQPMETAADEADTEMAAPRQVSTEEALYVPTRVIDNMYKMIGELVTMTNQIQSYLRNIKLQGQEAQLQERIFQQHRMELEDLVNVQRITSMQRQRIHPTQAPGKAKAGDPVSGIVQEEDFDALEMEQYDELYGSINCFIEAVMDSNEIQHSIQSRLTELEDMVVKQQRLNTELQQTVMNARMVAVNTISARLQRAVRQTARVTGKRVQLVIEGENLFIDCDVLTSLTDPILHMLRNAVDHGIEEPREREAAGKPLVGTIHLKFSQHGSHIEVQCIDDGRGLDYEKIRKSAIRKKLLRKREKVDKARLAKLILSPGFTTRDKVTRISGRGVGMDIVHNVIQSQGGEITIGDHEPCGCRICLRLPISLVTTHTLLVKAAEELFAVPSSTVSQIVPPQLGIYYPADGGLVYKEGDNEYPAVFLSSLTGGNTASGPRADESGETPKVALLVKGDDEQTTAVLVDQVVSSDDLVLKGTGKFAPNIYGITGVSILGDGNVVPVLNLRELMHAHAETETGDEPLRPEVENVYSRGGVVAKVLIVDDSISVRKSLSELVEDAGYKALVARNGVEAIDVMRKNNPDIILSDMEMPKMTGLELASNIRADKDFGELPIIMITSRTSRKHRKRATQAGVNEYLTKPYSEDELLELIDSLYWGKQVPAGTGLLAD